MRQSRKCSLLFGVVALLGVVMAMVPAFAAKPVDDDGNQIGSGFPSGAHFNLNIIGKRNNFSCPPPEWDETGQQIYGNVIFVPREQGTYPISILMESGRKGPKSKPTTVGLEVTDWCSESFPDAGGGSPPLGDPAVLRLPKHDYGYAVYARITGKPGNNESERTFYAVPELVLVQDEAGNDLILLGLVSPTGVFNAEGWLLKRTDDSKTGKRVRKATDITALFEWSGEVCYLEADSDPYCLADDGTNLCSPWALCCVNVDSDGIFDRCDPLTGVGVDPDGDSNFVCPETDQAGNLYTAVDAQCRSYDNEWVFNIGDYVDVLWHLDSTGSYVVQIRFYPQ